jgi:hypothetical protein
VSAAERQRRRELERQVADLRIEQNLLKRSVAFGSRRSRDAQPLTAIKTIHRAHPDYGSPRVT